ncbi:MULTISPECIES: DUF2282 domain-containing protein [Legionella]|uniref:Signal peptide protein n=1 Tax=Legionella donaldsonii TaxID=45060 RepID=A0A378J299_9GAMM|nr:MULTISPECIES: DUF2282 domain-containing protein [Legionella]MCC5015821.1 DUF2282 domain-containing protein [Legionella sp. 31fI33]STX41091.1 signal peptide protein [Legionella donaldsonii]
MVDKNKLIKSAMTAFLVLAATPSIGTTNSNASDPSAAPATEKCYGVVRAGFNDCATATSSCAGSSTKDAQPDAFVFVPQGLCEKLVGGHLTADKKS